MKNRFLHSKKKISYTFPKQKSYACTKKPSFPNKNNFFQLLEKAKDLLYQNIIIVRRFFLVCNNSFYTQLAFVFHLLENFDIARDHIVTTFLFLF